MTKNNFLYLNIIFSLGIFGLILYSNLAKSGGDIAIVILNVLFGIIQILFVFIYGLIKKRVNGKVILVIVICQLVEFLIFINFGKEINRYYKIHYLNNEVVTYDNCTLDRCNIEISDNESDMLAVNYSI